MRGVSGGEVRGGVGGGGEVRGGAGGGGASTRLEGRDAGFNWMYHLVRIISPWTISLTSALNRVSL